MESWISKIFLSYWKIVNSSPNQNIWISRKCRISKISGIFRMSRISRIYRTSRLSRTSRIPRISGIFPLRVNSWSWAPETWRTPSNDQSANQTAAKRPVCHLVAGVWQRTTAYDQIWASKKKFFFEKIMDMAGTVITLHISNAAISLSSRHINTGR